MTFYVSLPRGKTRLEKMYKDCQTRINFLEFISKIEIDDWEKFDVSQFLNENKSLNIEAANCLIDGTLRDRLSHFTLRLCCHQSYSFYNFFLANEVKLYRLRLRKQNLSEKCSSLRSVRRQISHVLLTEPDLNNDFSDILKEVKNLAASLLTYYSTNVPFKYSVPFYRVCKLVELGKVSLSKGQAIINVPEDLEDLLASLYEEIMSQAVLIQKVSHFARNLETDERFSRFLKQILGEFKQLENGSRISIGSEAKLTLRNFENAVYSFPPCMANLNLALNKHHRLSHKGRIQYTLFLKDCGLSLQSNVKFWGQHYSQPLSRHPCAGGCSHDWERDAKRYIYGLRHLYGMEGSKTSYSGHSCHSLQDTRGAVEQGGCPFVHFDNDYLKRYLSSEPCLSHGDIEDILSSRDEPIVACKKFLFSNVPDDKKIQSLTEMSFKKPSEYFAISQKLRNILRQF